MTDIRASPAARRSPRSRRQLPLAFLPGLPRPRRACAGAATGDAEAQRRCSIRSPRICFGCQPEGATSLGIDTGDRAALRSQLGDRSAAGQAAARRDASGPTSRAPKRSTSPACPSPTRTSVEVVRSAYRTALEGFALPYGDVAVGGWRNTPYVVIQNVGAYHRHAAASSTPTIRSRPRPTPRPISPASRNIPTQLDGELGRMRAARAQGPGPARLPDRQGDQPARHRAEERAATAAASSNSLVTTDQGEEHRRRLGRARPQDRHGSRSRPRSNARSPS